MNYKVHVNAMVSDETTGFEAGIDINVKGGQNIATVGQAVQTAIEIVSPQVIVAPEPSQE